MKKNQTKFRKKIGNRVFSFDIMFLLLGVIMVSVFFSPSKNVLQAVEGNGQQALCENSPVDIVLVMDRSGSMDAGVCEIIGYGIYDNVTEIWCNSYNGIFTPNDTPSRLSQAQNAAGLFLSKLGTGDQSALVSYANTATLDKALDNTHIDDLPLVSTKLAINDLVATGGTNIGDAIVKGTAELNTSARTDVTKTMILLTDGRPTCPIINSEHSECGYVEDQGDIDYAEEKAIEAASAGIKIFTIGLGTDVNTTLLTNIATITGAQYYVASNGNYLDDIYNLISEEICYGSISGCKYGADVNGNIDINDKLSDWEIVLSGDTNLSQLTIDGCYSFQNLPTGNYSISEGLNINKQPYLQTYPASLIYDNISLDSQDLNEFDFGNYFPVCGNGILDSSFSEQCDDGNIANGDGCSGICQIETPISQCSDGVNNNDGDELIDILDPGCHSDGDETNSDSYIPEDDDEYNGPVDEGSAIINELMWMGSSPLNTADEWIELKNTTTSNLDLGGCYLNKFNGTENLMLSIPNGSVINANGYYLISNYNSDSDKSNINIIPNLESTSVSLLNSGLQIKLYCGKTLIDTADDGDGVPLAGDNGDIKKSMSRRVAEDGTLPENWCDAQTRVNWDTQTTEMGTPGAENICNRISGYKFNDLNGNGNQDEGEPKLKDWFIYLYDNSDLLTSITSVKTSADLLNLGYYEFKNLVPGIYFVTEENRSGWQQKTPIVPNNYYGIDLSTVPISENNNFGNYQEVVPQCTDGEINTSYSGPEGTEGVGICRASKQTCAGGNWGEFIGEIIPQGEICGNGIDEDCNGSDVSCGGGGGGGGTVITKPVIKITNEKVVYLGDGKADVSWTTNIETTEQVAYGDNSITTLGNVPEYGYDLVNDESGFMTKEHSVKIIGLTDGIPNYFRPIADRTGSTGEKVGIEVFYKLGEVKGVEAPEIPDIPEAPCDYLLEYIKLGVDNNPVEVEKLETFLNVFEGEQLAVNGIYEQTDFEAVSRFQDKYIDLVLSPWSHNSSTGYVYITTKKRINEIFCQKDFPLTPEQENEISSYSSRFSNFSSELIQEPQENQQSSVVEDEEKSVEELIKKDTGEVRGVEDKEEASEDQQPLPLDSSSSELSDISATSPGIEDETIDEQQEEEQSSLLAGIGYIFTLGTGNVWLDFLIGIVILLILGGLINYFLKRERRKKK